MDRPATLVRHDDPDPVRDVAADEVETSAEPPVRFPMDDEERNLVDRVEQELVVEE